MPQPASQSSSAIPPLPPGYKLDQQPQAIPPLPSGYKLDQSDSAVTPPAAVRPFMGRVVDRISQSLAGLPDIPGKIADDPKGAALGMVDSITSVSTPGLINRLIHHDDPANIVGDTSAALGTQMLGGEGQPPTRGSAAAAMQPAESTGRLGRLVDVAKDEVHVPIVGRISKYWKAWKGPEPPAPPTPAAPLSSDATGVPSGWQQLSPEVMKASGLMEGGKPPAEPAAGLGKVPVRGSIAKAFKDPGAPLPEAPAPEVTQAQSLFYGGKPAADPAAGLGKVPVRGSIARSMAAPTNAEPSPIAETPAAQQSAASPPAPRPISRGQLSKSMDEQLGKALGAKPLNPKEPLRSQMPGRMPEPAESAELLEGHVPVESSWIKSYKYDPATREFEMHPKSGNAVRLGDVSPEDAAEFGKAESKGKSWQAIQRSPLVAKRIDGKWVAVKPARAAAD